MPADSIPAAHSALTETSAHPVSKSSFKERLHDPTPTQKSPCMGRARHIRRNWQPQCPWGQKAKCSMRAHVFRFAPGSELKSDIAGGPVRADFVAKVGCT